MSGRFGWLVSYPKSGNTWLRMMLFSVMSGRTAVDINGLGSEAGIAHFADMDMLFGIDSSELTEAELAEARPAFHAALAADNTQNLLLRKVHDRYWLTPSGVPAFTPDLSQGAIYLIRDPRDVAVSYAHHRGVDIDEIVERMADDALFLGGADSRGKEQLPQPLGSWSGHARSWLEQTDIPVLVIRYEDMLRDPLTSLSRITAHLGITATLGQLQAAVVATRFDTLSRQEQALGFRERLAGATAPFFREGRSGGWRAQLSDAHAQRITDRHGLIMARFGYLP